MRVKTIWTNAGSDIQKSRLAYSWPHGGETFSFDLGGLMRGGEFEDHVFSAEVKNYEMDHDQAGQYKTFLAQCYVALGDCPKYCNHFMWITWAPFAVTKWQYLCSPGHVRDAVLDNRQRVLGTADHVEATELIDDERVAKVADRLWVIVLSEKQEQLVPLTEWRQVVDWHLAKGGEEK